MENKFKISTQDLVIAAILSALSIILTRFLSIMLTPALRIGLGTVPLMLVGLLFGPVTGACAGLVTDVIGVLINPQGSFHLGFTLSAILTGMIPGLVCMLCSRVRSLNVNVFKIFLSVVLVYLGIHLILNTVWLHQLMGKAFYALVITRALKVGIESIVCFGLLYLIMEQLIPRIRRR